MRYLSSKVRRFSRAMCKTFLVFALLLTATHAVADDWATRLGYPEGAKVLVVHAHRMGLSFESNEAIEKLMDSGVVSSASAMPTCPWFTAAAQWRQQRGDLDVGLDFTLNSHLPLYRWTPVSNSRDVASLVDRDGYQWQNVVQVMVNAKVDEVEQELRMQLLHADRMGLKPTHFTTHLGALYARPDLAEMYLRLSREQWIPAVVINLTPELAERFRQDGYPVPDTLVRALDDYPFPKVRDLLILPQADSLEAKAAATAKLIAELPPGLVQLSFAPATDSPALRAMDPNWQQRVWDAQVWENEAVKAELAKEDVVITNWKEIMQRFDGSVE